MRLDNEYIFDQDVGVVFSNILALIADGKRSLSGGPDAAESEFPQQGTLVHLFKKSSAQDVGDRFHFL